jgi:hypothetical protein
LLKYVDKEKHIEGLMDKLFVKLRNSTDNLEWRNNTFVLSELNYNSEKILNKFLQSYSEIRDKNDDLPEVKENLAKIFNKLERIQNLSENVLNNLKECKEKIFKGEKFKFNSKYKSNSVGSSQRSSRNGSKKSSRSGSKEKGGPPKRTHRQIDLAKIDEEINEGIEENEKNGNNMNVLAKKKGGKKKSSDKKKKASKGGANKSKKKKRNKSKNSSSSSSDDEDYDGKE